MFEIILGRYSGPRNKISKQFDSQQSYTCKSNGPLNVKAPELTINTPNNLCELNYCYIPEFKRYYYIDNVVVMPNNIWLLHCQVDVLKSYEQQLQTCRVALNRSVDFFNVYLPDNMAPVTSRQIVSSHIFPKTPFDSDFSSHGAIVTIAGGSS